MKIEKFVKFILKYMTAEEALTKLIGTTAALYDAKMKQCTEEQRAKAEAEGGSVVEGNPLFVMCMCAMELGWSIGVEKGDKDSLVRGLIVGTPEYLKENYSGYKDHETNETP